MKIEHLNWEWAYLTLEALARGCESAIKAHEEHNRTYSPTGAEHDLRLEIRTHMTHIESQLRDCRSRAAYIFRCIQRINEINTQDQPIEPDIPF